MSPTAAAILFVNIVCPLYVAWILGKGWAGAKAAGGSRLSIYQAAATIAAIAFASAYGLVVVCILSYWNPFDLVTDVLGGFAISLVLGMITAVSLIDASSRFHAARLLSKRE